MESKKFRVLILDDVKFFTELVKTTLERHNIEVIECQDPIEAIEIVTNSSLLFDLILTDIDMPSLNGFEFVEGLRNKQEFYNVPIIFITAMINSKVNLKAYENYVLDVIVKPIEIQSFSARIISYLENFRMIKYSSFILDSGNFMGSNLDDLFADISEKKLNVILSIINEAEGKAHISFLNGELTDANITKAKVELFEGADALEEISKWDSCRYIIYHPAIKEFKPSF